MYFKLEEATIIKFGLNPRIKCLSESYLYKETLLTRIQFK